MGFNIIQADRNRADKSTLSGGRWFSTMPLEEMQNKDQEDVARSKGVSSVDTQWVVTMAEELSIRALALFNHNMSQSATIRIICKDAVGGVLYDTGVENVWPVIVPLSQAVFSEPNFLFGRLLSEDLEGYRPKYFHFMPVAIRPNTIEYFIDDSENYNEVVSSTDISAIAADNSFNTAGAVDFSAFTAGQTFSVVGGGNSGDHIVDTSVGGKITTLAGGIVDESAGGEISIKTGYVQIGRLWHSPFEFGDRNVSFGNAGQTKDNTKVTKDDSARQSYDVLDKTRKFKGTIRGLTKAQGMKLKEQQRRVGVSGEVFIIPAPDDVENSQFESFLGHYVSLAPLVNTSPGRFSINIDAEENI